MHASQNIPLPQILQSTLVWLFGCATLVGRFVGKLTTRVTLLIGFIICGSSFVHSGELEDQVSLLVEQNKVLLELVQKQQKEINALSNRVNAIDQAREEQVEEIEEIREIATENTFFKQARQTFSNNIHISGEAGIAFFSGGSNGIFPNDEFRVDDAKLLIEAQVTEGVYLVTELEMYKRESRNRDFEVGELYVEIENLIQVDGYDRLINFRGGRMNIPFGMEYQLRNVMNNPLITHSVADFWGIDEGIELFGEAGNFNYVIAVQNGSISRFHDFDSDEAITVRMGYSVSSNLNLNLSWMRTGDLNLEDDGKSEMWIGNGFFLSPDWPQPTVFSAEMVQVEGDYHWDSGSFRGSFGHAWYSDDIGTNINSREFDFYMLEVQQYLNESLYLAVRYSGLEVDKPYPLRGLGNGSYLFGGNLSTELTRLTLGTGYWMRENVLFKMEYSFEEGGRGAWWKRTGTDQLAAELGVKF